MERIKRFKPRVEVRNMEVIDTSFLDSVNPVWSVKFLKKLFKYIDDVKDYYANETSERTFKVFESALNEAISNFLLEIKGIDLIINCRTKCDGDSNFGGSICAKFAEKVSTICNKCIEASGSLPKIRHDIRKIGIKAKNDCAIANKFESDTKNAYLSTGEDQTKKIFKTSGYFNNTYPINSISDLKNYKRGGGLFCVIPD